MSALKAMFSFFTMLRLDIDEKDMDDMNRKFHLIPIVGVFYGAVAGMLMLLLNEVVPMLVAAVLTMFVIQCINRFLHIDGTVDVGDGLVVAGTREDHLRALKDTNIGAGGMAFALFVIILTVAALSGLTADYLILAPFMAEVLAKNAMVSAAASGTPGNGMAGDSVRYTSARHVIISSAMSIAFIFVLTFALDRFDIVRIEWIMFPCIVILTIVSIVAGWVMSRIAERNFGMVNGDVLGATNEITRMIILICMLGLITVM